MNVWIHPILLKNCVIKNISVSELARRIGQTPQNFGKKLKRDTVTLDELNQIADMSKNLHSMRMKSFILESR